MSDPIKHHIVPQCYIKRFSVDKITVKYFNKLLNKFDKKNINEICYINNLYTLSQSEPYLIETTLFANDIEDKLARILTYFENIDFNLSSINYNRTLRNNLAKQIVLQYMRTPIYRNTRSLNELDTYYGIIKNAMSKINFEVEKIEFIPNNMAEYHKTILLEDKSDIVSIISNANWELIYTSSEEFYTSDNPVTIKTSNNIDYDEAIKNFEAIFYPLNSHLLLHINNEKSKSFKSIPISRISDSELGKINDLIKENAIECIIYKNNFK